MERSYYRDGTPLDILRRRAKAMKRENEISLAKALDLVALEHNELSWEFLTKNCWAEPFSEPGIEDDHYMIEQLSGEDLIVLDLVQLPDALYSVVDWADFNETRQNHVYLETEACVGSFRGVRYYTHLHDMPDHPQAMTRRAPFLNEACFNALTKALGNYEEEGRVGPLIAGLNEWGILDSTPLMSARKGELDALLELELRAKRLFIKERHLLNIGRPKDKTLPPGWDNLRAFPFMLTCGKVAVCNGASEKSRFRSRVFTQTEWKPIEAELHAAFPAGPDTTFESETWLRRRLNMDAWDDPSNDVLEGMQ